MIGQRPNKTTAALGLYGTQHAWTLVKLERSGAGFRVASKHSAAREIGGVDQDALRRLFDEQHPDDRGLPLCVALADHEGMYRRITAPPADDALLGKVVVAQVETMLPGGADLVHCGWSRAGAGNDLWVHAVVKPAVQSVLASLPGGVRAACVISDTMAVARSALSAEANAPGSSLVLSVGQTRSALVLVHDGQLKGVMVCDGGDGAASTTGAEHGAWLAQLRDARDELLGSVPPGQRPARCQYLWMTGGHRPPLANAGDALGMPVDPWSGAGDIAGIAADDAAGFIAAHAAAACLDPLTPVIRLGGRVDEDVSSGQLRKYAGAAGVWLLIALAALYASDRYRALRLDALLAEGALDETSVARLDRQTAVIRYLETAGPTPLAIIDEIGQKTDSFMFEVLSYQRGGTVRIGGKLGAADQVGKLTESLSSAKTLSSVQLQSQTASDKEVRFEIVANTSPRFFGAFVEPPPAKPDEAKQKPEPDKSLPQPPEDATRKDHVQD